MSLLLRGEWGLESAGHQGFLESLIESFGILEARRWVLRLGTGALRGHGFFSFPGFAAAEPPEDVAVWGPEVWAGPGFGTGRGTDHAVEFDGADF